MASETNEDAALARTEDIANGQLRQYVSPLVSLEQQVGAHIIHALQQDHTVAVLTTVTPGPQGTQCIVSVGLSGDHLEDVQQLLANSQAIEPRVPCIGFHCFVQPRDDQSNGS